MEKYLETLEHVSSVKYDLRMSENEIHTDGVAEWISVDDVRYGHRNISFNKCITRIKSNDPSIQEMRIHTVALRWEFEKPKSNMFSDLEYITCLVHDPTIYSMIIYCDGYPPIYLKKFNIVSSIETILASIGRPIARIQIKKLFETFLLGG